MQHPAQPRLLVPLLPRKPRLLRRLPLPLRPLLPEKQAPMRPLLSTSPLNIPSRVTSFTMTSVKRMNVAEALGEKDYSSTIESKQKMYLQYWCPVLEVLLYVRISNYKIKHAAAVPQQFCLHISICFFAVIWPDSGHKHPASTKCMFQCPYSAAPPQRSPNLPWGDHH